MPHVKKGDLPDLFALPDGSRLRSAAAWRQQRETLSALILELAYGRLPPTPAAVRTELLHRDHPIARLHHAFLFQYRVIIEGGAQPFWFILDLLVPRGNGRFPVEGRHPVVVNGDACWKFVTDEVASAVLGRGYALATFNRTEIVPDNYTAARDSALYRVYPGRDFGALSAWAWGYHRVVDVLSTLDCIDATRIAAVGHSRGGKTVLLAGATDERIAVTAPNNSGSLGAGCFRWQGEGSEKIEDGINAVPYWFSPRLREFIGREVELPFDQHALKALVAPRALLTTEALGDLWANPTGTVQTHRAAREVYRFLGAAERIGLWYRDGQHDHGIADWQAFLDFADRQFQRGTNRTPFDRDPFPDMADAFTWAAPR